MNCQQTQTLLHPYVDGELDLVKNLEIEQHLGDCPACARSHSELQALRATVHGGGLYFPAPPELAGRIRESLWAPGQTETLGPARQTKPPRPIRWPRLAMAASLAFVAVTSWGLSRYFYSPSSKENLSQELLASHVRSQMLDSHWVDAKTSDKHTIKRLFEMDGKFDFSPPIIDLKDQGFSLIGGRLDYLNNRGVAVLVFKRRNHFINLSIWAAESGAEAGPTALTRQGFSLVNWTRSGMTFWAVSSLDKDDLEEFGRLFRDKVR